MVLIYVSLDWDDEVVQVVGADGTLRDLGSAPL